MNAVRYLRGAMISCFNPFGFHPAQAVPRKDDNRDVGLPDAEMKSPRGKARADWRGGAAFRSEDTGPEAASL